MIDACFLEHFSDRLANKIGKNNAEIMVVKTGAKVVGKSMNVSLQRIKGIKSLESYEQI